ncbi:acid protease [Parathielavia hyrcaniae]|uniref:Probable aspartic-type endopeptidase OPSB n=1 Tax=Parathielavia hyrcaniae TaxID=113614 RepID=A0AAN6QD51_9PEZI|nr:acid protease [Parathielavia hyrcaniae]
MKASVYQAFTAALAPIVGGLVIPPEHNGQKVLCLETERVTEPRNQLARHMPRKRDAIEAGLENLKTLYLINATIGTPGSPVRLHIDTGSSDLWVNTPQSDLCTTDAKPCSSGGTYSANASSTYQYIANNFNITYVDGNAATGDYVSDTVTIGSQRLDRLQFGVGYSSTNAQGILGIGYPLNEVQVGRAGLGPYSNLPAQLVAEGLIQSSAYSIWLNDLDANTGNILFGGVDAHKYVAPLLSLPIESASGVYSEFMITLTRLQLDNTTISGGDLALAVLLDTGSSLTYLPDHLVHEIYSVVGAKYDPDINAAYVPCSMGRRHHRPGTGGPHRLHFTFSEPTISVPISELVLDIVMPSSKTTSTSNSNSNPTLTSTLENNNNNIERSPNHCLFGIAPAHKASTYVLGDTFLRSAYTVYDLENNAVALAQARFGGGGSGDTTQRRVAEIVGGGGGGKGGRGIPGATPGILGEG